MLKPIFRICKSSDDVTKVLDRISNSVELVSFDVFDTLLQRPLMDPDWTKIPAAKSLHRLLSARGIRPSEREVLERRFEIERSLRSNAEKSGTDPEFHIRDMIQHWLEIFMGPEEAAQLVPDILEAELAVEKSLCFAVAGMPDAVRKARSSGKKVVFVSDMYLGEEHIARLLDANGYQDMYDKLYVSSEFKLAKGSGRLFKLILESEGLIPGRWIHFGDNQWSDFAVPKKMGGRAYLYSPLGLSLSNTRQRRLKRLCEVSSQWLGAELMENCHMQRKTDRSTSPAQEIGFSVLGPVFTNFIHRVIDRVLDQQIEMIIFPARDGFLLNEIGKKLWPCLSDLEYPGVYAFLSRKSVYPASLNEIGTREMYHGLGSRLPCLRSMFARFNLDPSSFEDLAGQCGMGLDTPILDKFSNFALLKFLRHPDFLKLVREKSAAYRSLLKDYLGQLGFWDVKSAAYVDVGWTGTTQDALTIAFLDEPRWPSLTGLYMACIRWQPIFDHSKSTYEGLFFDTSKDPLGKGPFGQFLEIYELASRAPHTTAVGFRRDSDTGTVIPVLRPDHCQSRAKELRDQELVEDLQAGILEFAEVYSRLIPYMVDSPDKYSSFILSQLDRFIRFPTKEEAKLFQNFYHQEDFGVDIVWQEPDPEFNWRRLDGWKSFISGYKRAFWRQGFSSATGIPGLLTLANLESTTNKRVF